MTAKFLTSTITTSCTRSITLMSASVMMMDGILLQGKVTTLIDSKVSLSCRCRCSSSHESTNTLKRCFSVVFLLYYRALVWPSSLIFFLVKSSWWFLLSRSRQTRCSTLPSDRGTVRYLISLMNHRRRPTYVNSSILCFKV